MPVQALSSTSRDMITGQVWPLTVIVLDADGEPFDAATSVAITLPDGSAGTAPTVEELAPAVDRYEYTPAVPGRYLAEVTAAGYGRVVFVAHVAAPTGTAELPDVDAVDDYLRSGSGDHDWSASDLAGALAAETAAQRRVCRIGPVYPADLREALLRRVQRNLALRSNPLAMFRGDADAGGAQAFLPGTDPEVKRLERPYRKVPTG